ncbi:hypothetical protein QOT17_000853 [Balamuthia mandrillaris]
MDASLLERKWEEAANDFERSMRRVQKACYECSAKCSDNLSLSKTDYERCVQRCSMPTRIVGQSFSNEANNFQNQYSRCIQVCQDKIQHQIPPGATEIPKHLNDEMMKCANQCTQQYADLVPSVFSRLKKVAEDAQSHSSS